MKPVISRRVVLVSGAPGVGKTTIAEPLAAMLGFALISKDHIKETLFDTLNGKQGDLAYSRQLGGAAMELLWSLAARCPQVVLEANFRPHSDYERSRISALEGQIVEVYCYCPREEIKRRFATRAQTGARHPTHILTTLSSELLDEYDGPIGIGKVVEVDTSTPMDIPRLVERIRDL
ncbi:MAG: AAA family ATPase [Chloroflexota bacterium]